MYYNIILYLPSRKFRKRKAFLNYDLEKTPTANSYKLHIVIFGGFSEKKKVE